MKKQTLVLSILTAGFITVPLLAAQAGCCGADTGAMAGCSQMSGHKAHAAKTNAAAIQLPEPAKTVFGNYLKIQTVLAQDFIQTLHDTTALKDRALAIATSVRHDSAKTFPDAVAQQADTLASATDLKAARQAFKPLSQSLIQYVSKNPALIGTYRQVHCSMANADWLQTDSIVSNPYMGKAMMRCGEFVKGSGSEAQPDHSAHLH